jgi:D-3-phosphoglycerate dehydrogenase
MKPLQECKVLVTATSYASQDESLKIDLESKVADVRYNTTGKPLTSLQLQEMLPGVDGMIAGLDEINDQALLAAKELKVVARYGVGVNNVDLEAAKRRGIIVTNTPGANSKSVAELTVALILLLLRPVMQCAQLTREGGWPRFKGISLEGKTVGLFGFGAIGKEVARRLSGFDCSLLAYDIQKDDKFASQHNVVYVSADDLLKRSDVLSLHVPGTPDTVEMVNDGFIQKMKKGAWLVNTSRGDLVNEKALVQALESGRLRGAALDVYQEEPPRRDNPLLALENIIPTPHMGAHADSATNRMGRMALEECFRVLSGEGSRYRVI